LDRANLLFDGDWLSGVEQGRPGACRLFIPDLRLAGTPAAGQVVRRGQGYSYATIELETEKAAHALHCLRHFLKLSRKFQDSLPAMVNPS
jgi:hypothetical protein